MTGFKSLLVDFKKKYGPSVTYGDNGNGVTKRYGSIKCNSIVFKNVSYGKRLQYNLISINQLCDAGYDVLFNKKEGKVVHQKNITVLSVNRQNDIYVLDMLFADNSLQGLQGINL